MTYAEWLVDLKSRICVVQQRATLQVYHELVLLYCQIGHAILECQKAAGWGVNVIEQLDRDLTAVSSDMKGFSSRILLYVRSVADERPGPEFVQQAVAQLPWGQNLLVLTKLKIRSDREWYLAKAILHRWVRNVMRRKPFVPLHPCFRNAETTPS